MYKNNEMYDKAISKKVYSGSGIPDTVIEQFLKWWIPVDRIGFYPSSGTDVSQVFGMKCDAFFVADYFRRNILESCILEFNENFIVFEQGDKRGYFFLKDNNEVLQLLEACNIKLSLFVGVRDGCEEGGNYQCTNAIPFLEQVIALACDDGMDVYVDHSRFLEEYPNFIFGDRLIQWQGITSKEFNDHPIGEIKHYIVSKHTPQVWEWKNENIHLTLEYDSILNHITELDQIVCYGLCAALVRYKIGDEVFHNKIASLENFIRPMSNKNSNSGNLPHHILCELNHSDSNSVGLAVFGQGQHQDFLKILKDYPYQEELWIRLFFVNKEDFLTLKNMMNLQ